jgi:outer membrane protein assembly factor BamB
MPIRIGCMIVTLMFSFSCKESFTDAIHFVGLQDGPCVTGGGGDGQATSGGVPTVLFGTVPLRVVSTSGKDFGALKLTIGTETQTLSSFVEIYSFDSRLRPDGDLTLSAEAEDSDGHRLTTEVRVCVDNAGPQLKLVSPAEGARIWIEDTLLAVRFQVGDQLGLERLRARLIISGKVLERVCTIEGSGDSISCDLIPAEGDFSIPPGGEVEAKLEILARDGAGHESSSQRPLKAKTRLKWSMDLKGSVTWPVEILSENRIAAATDVGRVWVIDTSKPSEVCHWDKPAVDDTRTKIMTPLAVSKSTKQLIFGSEFFLWSLSVDTCQYEPASYPLATIFPNSYFTGARPAIRETNGAAIAVIAATGNSTTKGFLRAINTKTGQVMGSLDIVPGNTIISGSPILSADAKTVYLGTEDKKVLAVSLTDDGQLAGKGAPWPIDAKSEIYDRLLLLGDNLFFSTDNGQVFSVRADTGAVASGFPVTLDEKGGLATMGSPASGELLYIGSTYKDDFFSLKSTGEKGTALLIGPMDRNSAPAFNGEGANRIVYAATKTLPEDKSGQPPTGGRLYALAADLTKTHWFFQRKDPFIASPVISGDTIYIGNTDGFLYALEAAAP